MRRLYYLITVCVVGSALGETDSQNTPELEQESDGPGAGKNSTAENSALDRINPGFFAGNGFGTYSGHATGYGTSGTGNGYGTYPGAPHGTGFHSINGNGFGMGTGYTCLCPGGQTGIITTSNIPHNPFHGQGGQNGGTNAGFGKPMYQNQPHYPGSFPNFYGGTQMNGNSFGGRTSNNQGGGNNPANHNEMNR